jgi:hypothetical protein
MYYLPLIPLIVLVYIISVDSNVSEYLHLRLLKVPLLFIRTSLFKYKLLFQLKYEKFMLKRGVVSRRHMDMASQLMSERSDSGAD